MNKGGTWPEERLYTSSVCTAARRRRHRRAGRPAGTIDAVRIPIARPVAEAATAKTTTRSLQEIILVVVPRRSSADRSIFSVARIPLDLTSLRGCPASRPVAARLAHTDVLSLGDSLGSSPGSCQNRTAPMNNPRTMGQFRTLLKME